MSSEEKNYQNLKGSSAKRPLQSLFVRQSTGLVREISLFDSFIFNLAANPIGLALVFVLGFEIGLFPGGDPVLAIILVGIVSLFIAATYAQLSASFPRSGGDYIFNSRILHPSLGFGFNLSLSFWEWLTASLSLSFITTLGLSPVTVMIGYLTNRSDLIGIGTSLASPTNVFVIGTIFNALISIFFLIGTKRTIRLVDAFYIASLIGVLLIIVSLLGSSPAHFQNSLNAFLHSIGSSQTYEGIIQAAQTNGMSLPSSYSFYLLPAMMGVVSIEAIWYFWSSYLGGEIKRGSSVRRQSTAMLGAGLFNGLLTLVAVVLYLNVIGKGFITAFSYLLTSAPSLVPFAPATVSGDQIVIFASLATSNSLIAILIPVLFIGWSIVVVVDYAMQPVRSVFAWSMDRLIPSKFSDVSPRFHTPVFPVILGALIMEAGLVAQVAFPNAVLLIFTASIVAPAFSSMFMTGLSGVLLPLRKKALFRNTPIAKFKIAGIPLISITGAVTSGYILFLVYVFFSYPNFGLNTPFMEFLAFGLNLVGIVLYFVIREYRRRRRSGIDVRFAFEEIPPE